MSHITVVDGHPDPSEAHLNHALADHYVRAARAAGHEVRRIDVAKIDFPLLRSTSEFYDKQAPEALQPAQRDIAWADHLVFFYPLWHGNMPALLKAFIEQTFRPGFAMAYAGALRFPKQLFKGKSARVVVTMGMPAFIYRTYFGAYGVKSFERSALRLCGIAPVSETLLGGAGGDCERRVRKWFELMETLAEADADPKAARLRKSVRTAVRALLVLGGSYAAFLLAASISESWFRASDGESRQLTQTAEPQSD
jgi:putative NADPH-quinone reductase